MASGPVAVLLSLEHGSHISGGATVPMRSWGRPAEPSWALGTVAGVTLWLAPASFESWGWRIPFALSALLVAFGLWLRRGVEETPVFTQMKSQRATAQAPIKDVARHHRRPLLTSIAARVGPDVAYALLVVFTLTYATTILHLPRPLALTATMIGAACSAVGIPVFALPVRSRWPTARLCGRPRYCR